MERDTTVQTRPGAFLSMQFHSEILNVVRKYYTAFICKIPYNVIITSQKLSIERDKYYEKM